MSLPNDKEQLRAILVIGLIASIIALGQYVPKETPSISIIFGIVVTYWFLYAIFTAYGISETENIKWSNRFRRLGDLSFRFAAYVLAAVLMMIIMEKFGLIWVLEWNYLVAWFSVAVFYFVPKFYIRPLLYELKHWEGFTDRIKSNLKDYFWDWVLFLFMSSPLLVLQFYKLVL